MLKFALILMWVGGAAPVTIDGFASEMACHTAGNLYANTASLEASELYTNDYEYYRERYSYVCLPKQ